MVSHGLGVVLQSSSKRGVQSVIEMFCVIVQASTHALVGQPAYLLPNMEIKKKNDNNANIV